MTLSADQIANTTAAEFDVRLRYFAAAADYDTLTLAILEFGARRLPGQFQVTQSPAGTWVKSPTGVCARL